MKVNSINNETQKIVAQSNNPAIKVKLARSTDSIEVQKTLLEEGIPRVLVALASNENLAPEVEIALAKIAQAKGYNGVLMNLVSKSEKGGQND